MLRSIAVAGLLLIAAQALAADVVLTTPQGSRRFQLLRPINHGYFSETHEAVEPATGQHVAIKVMKPEILKSTTRDNGYRNEVSIIQNARAASQRAGRATTLPQMFGVGRHEDGRDALVMELLAGAPLAAKARSASQSAQIGLQVLRGTRALHLSGQRHNDLHPGNVLMQGDDPNSVRVIDVGWATPIAKPNVGSPGGYHAPEPRAIGVTPDIYSAAAIIYYARTGQEPASVPDLSKIPEPALRAVLAKAMHRDPLQRYQNDQDFMEALRPVAAAP